MARQSQAKETVSNRRRRSEARGKPRLRRIDAERHSLALILNLVRSAQARTRHDLEQLSGLGRAVVTDRLATLLRLGLVHEGELGPASGGRAPRLVSFRADAGLVLVAMLDRSTMGVGIADLAGRLLFEHHEAVDLPADAEPPVKRLGTLFDWVLEQHGAEREVWGIGVAVPGPVSPQPVAQVGKTPSMPRDGEVVATELYERYKAPVSLGTAYQMRTLGEWRAGNGAGAQSLLFVDLGREISAGVVSGGRLLLGAQGAAGLIGHVSTGDDNQIICRCGNRGCLEVVAGADALVREARRAAEEGRSRLLADLLAAGGVPSVADIGLAAQRGDAFSAELLSRCGREIGTVLATLTNAINPSVIVLGGEVAETGDIVLAAIREAVYRRSHPLVTRDLSITRSQLGNSAGLVGAALTLVDGFFAADFLNHWIAHGSPLQHPEIVGRVDRKPAAARPLPPTPGALRAAAGK